MDNKLCNILSSPFILKMGEICDLMYHKGWNERNGGNISYLLSKEELARYIDTEVKVQSDRTFDLECQISELANMYFLVTGTGKYLKNVKNDPEGNLGIIRISEDGSKYDIIWGLPNSKPTSEISTHLLSHAARLKVDSNHKVIIHNHATNIEAMTFICKLDDTEFTKILWKMQTESLIVFPEGVGVLPWMVCGSDAIGKVTAQKMKEYRLVVWGHHGILGAGTSLEEVFGLIETAEKAAEIYLKITSSNLPIQNTITDDNLIELAKAFKVNYNQKFLK